MHIFRQNSQSALLNSSPLRQHLNTSSLSNPLFRTTTNSLMPPRSTNTVEQIAQGVVDRIIGEVVNERLVWGRGGAGANGMGEEEKEEERV